MKLKELVEKTARTYLHCYDFLGERVYGKEYLETEIWYIEASDEPQTINVYFLGKAKED